MLASTVQFSSYGRDYRHVAPSGPPSGVHFGVWRSPVHALAWPVRNRSLRTQQRAWAPDPPSSQRSHRRTGCT